MELKKVTPIGEVILLWGNMLAQIVKNLCAKGKNMPFLESASENSIKIASIIFKKMLYKIKFCKPIFIKM